MVSWLTSPCNHGNIATLVSPAEGDFIQHKIAYISSSLALQLCEIAKKKFLIVTVFNKVFYA